MTASCACVRSNARSSIVAVTLLNVLKDQIGCLTCQSVASGEQHQHGMSRKSISGSSNMSFLRHILSVLVRSDWLTVFTELAPPRAPVLPSKRCPEELLVFAAISDLIATQWLIRKVREFTSVIELVKRVCLVSGMIESTSQDVPVLVGALASSSSHCYTPVS